MLSKHYMEKAQREANRSTLNTSCLLYRHVFFCSHQCCALFFFCSVISKSFFLLFIKWMYRSKPMLCYFANDNLPDGSLWGITARLTLQGKKHTRPLQTWFYRQMFQFKCWKLSTIWEEKNNKYTWVLTGFEFASAPGRRRLRPLQTSDSCGCVLKMRSWSSRIRRHTTGHTGHPKSSPLTSTRTTVINS